MQTELTYEEAMQKLEKITQQLESSQTGIDEMASQLKEAQQLIAHCRSKLYAADAEIQKILGNE